jgi:hypothetical protein
MIWGLLNVIVFIRNEGYFFDPSSIIEPRINDPENGDIPSIVS